MRFWNSVLLVLFVASCWWGCAKQTDTGNVKQNAEKAFEDLDREMKNYDE